MTHLVASPFSLPRKLISTLFISGLLACTTVFFRAWDFDIGLSHLLANQNSRNSSGLGFETDTYLHELIRKHDLSPRVEWAAWHVQSTQSQEEWTSVTRVPRRFQPQQPSVFDPRSGRPLQAQTLQTLALASPQGWRPGQFNVSRYLFGVTTTYERLMADDRAILKSWQWWLTDGRQDGNGNGAHVVVMLDRANDEQMQQVESALADLAIPAMVYNADEPLSTATRYAQLAGELRTYGSALSAVGIVKTWFVLLDDAIFLPSLSYLDEKLGAYDTQDSVYIGMPSEREDWAARDGRLSTSGGGVVILSLGALGRYLSLECAAMDTATDSPFHELRWTALLHACMTARGGIPMHIIPGLYSPIADDDDSESASWLDDLESGARPVALRSHDRSLDLAHAYLVADACGEACFAQRFLFPDRWVLVNGVSISQYQRPLRIRRHARAIRQDEAKARRGLNAQLQLHDTGRLDLTGGGARNVWVLLDSSVDDDVNVRQAYVKRDRRGKRASAVAKEEPLDSVILLVWNEGKRR